jgi:hypothetical protein
MNRLIEQQVFLKHDADLTAQPGWVDLRHVDAVDQDLTTFSHVKPLDQFRQGRFTRT